MTAESEYRAALKQAREALLSGCAYSRLNEMAQEDHEFPGLAEKSLTAIEAVLGDMGESGTTVSAPFNKEASSADGSPPSVSSHACKRVVGSNPAAPTNNQSEELINVILKTDCFGGSLAETISWFKQHQDAHHLFGSRPAHILSILEAIAAWKTRPAQTLQSTAGNFTIPQPPMELVERVARAICQMGNDTVEDFNESWKEYKVGYELEASAALSVIQAELEPVREALIESDRDYTITNRSGSRSRDGLQECLECEGIEGHGTDYTVQHEPECASIKRKEALATLDRIRGKV